MFQHDTDLVQRQLWNLPTSRTTTSGPSHCTPFTLPSNGVLSFANSAITLTTNVVFQPECTGGGDGVSMVDDLKDPFYASTIPQTYVIAAATVIAWILVVMLIITPRTAFFGSSSAAPTFGNGRGIIGGATGGGTNLIGVGSRPWLQKVAALTVAVSLTIATADTFKVARKQYVVGYTNAEALRDQVLGSLEIRITRVISDAFLWLAQVQTLIRLFPRHKEKVLIKWIGFALIIFDSVFSCLNSFIVGGTARPRYFVDAIPALSYLFELALGLLYAAWVLYYAVTKRRYAFYHPKMRNICLIALLSLIAVLTPVVFFVTDVSNQDVAGWGDYFRWVGAAAASVVVWEWVERIEALERDEKKDGILGREIFDGDEMLDITPSEEAVWAGSRRRRGRRGGGDDGEGGNESGALENGWVGRFRRGHQKAPEMHFPLGNAHSSTTGQTPEPGRPANGAGRITFGELPRPTEHSESSQTPMLGGGITAPAPVASPVSRSDTTSAASTVYVVRYDNATAAPQPVRRRFERGHNGNATGGQSSSSQNALQNTQPGAAEHQGQDGAEDEPSPNKNREQNRWLAVANPFKRKRASPPAEVQQARQVAGQQARSATPAHTFSRWDVKKRLGVLAADSGDNFRDRKASKPGDLSDLPVTVIPAQPRGGRTWSPDDLNQEQQQQAGAARGPTESGRASRSRAPHVVNIGSRTAGVSNRAPPNIHRASTKSRTTASSPLGAGVATSSTPSHVIVTRPSQAPPTGPPRADDLTPPNGNDGTTVVVPAPQRRSPPRITTPAIPGPCRSPGHG
jgi:hypothetical protein